MVVPTSTKQFQLRMGIESGERQQDGVLVFDDIPVGATVHAWVNRPSELNEDSDLNVTPRPQPYAFELAPPPAPFTVGGVLFNRDGFAGIPPRVPSAANPSSMQRVLVTDGDGGVEARQEVPVWAAFGAPVTGSLVQNGRSNHAMVMPGHSSLTPNLPPSQRNLLRMRWSGTAVAAGTPHGPDAAPTGYVFAATTVTRNDAGDWTTDIAVGDYVRITTAEDPANIGIFGPITVVTAGAITIPSAAFTVNADDSTAVFVRSTTLAIVTAALAASSTEWTSKHKNIVPGSVLVTLPTSAGTLRDNGKGRLVGADGDGTVNYLTGEFSLKFNAAETGDVTATYEHECLYRPLDVTLTFDPLLAQ